MARIAGVDLPREKRVEVGLTYIYGIGLKSSQKILAENGINPDTRVKDLTEAEVNSEYELNTGKVIAAHFKENDLDVASTPAVLVRSHAPFVFGKNASDAVHNAAVLEIVAEMALKTELLGNNGNEIDKYLSDKHYFRKHGENAYYGQK